MKLRLLRVSAFCHKADWSISKVDELHCVLLDGSVSGCVVCWCVSGARKAAYQFVCCVLRLVDRRGA